MFGKIVIVEESDLEFNAALRPRDVGDFAVLFQGELTVCGSYGQAKGVLHSLEN